MPVQVVEAPVGCNLQRAAGIRTDHHHALNKKKITIIFERSNSISFQNTIWYPVHTCPVGVGDKRRTE